MQKERQIFRTAAYLVVKDGQEHVFFWSIIPSGLDPEKSFVTEHDLYAGGATSKPVADHMSHLDALRRIAEIERQAETQYPRAGDDAFRHPSVNWQREEMAPWQEHPAYRDGPGASPSTPAREKAAGVWIEVIISSPLGEEGARAEGVGSWGYSVQQEFRSFKGALAPRSTPNFPP